MAYEKTTWAADMVISAKKLNHAETQYDEFETAMASHNHLDRYYPKAQADAKFFSSGKMGLGSGADADLLDGQHLSAIMGQAIPIKGIMRWSGSEASIPIGWAVCNGQTVNGITTWDLRDRFVVGKDVGSSIGQTGGAATITTAGGTVTIGNHQLTLSEIPAHWHDWVDNYGPSGASKTSDVAGVRTTTTTTRNANTGTTGGDQSHNHGTKAVSLSSFDNRPKYYALFYIQKVA